MRLMRADDTAAAAALAERIIHDAGAAADRGAEAAPGAHDPATQQALRAVQSAAGVLLSRVARRRDEQERAVRAVRAALRTARAAQDRAAECLARAEYSHLLNVIGRAEHALQEAHQSLEVALRAGQPRLEAAACESLAIANWRIEQWALALDLPQRALTLALDCDDAELCALSHASLAAAEDGLAADATTRGDTHAAVEHWQRSTTHARESARWWRVVGDVYNLCMALNAEAVALMGLNDLVAARGRLDANLATAGPPPSTRRTLALINLAQVDLRENAPHAAAERLHAALANAQSLALPYLIGASCEQLSEALERMGELAGALAYYRRYHAAYVQIASESAQTRARAIWVALDTERAQAGAEMQRQRADRLESSNAELALTAERLGRDALLDALTGIANRRRFDDMLRAEMAGRDASKPFSVALIDVDHFKQVNDRFSHLVGDQMLRRIGAMLADNCRRGDLAARFGGEEFVLLLDDLDRDAASAVCERVRRAVETEDWAAIQPGLAVTASIGLAHLGETPPGSEPQVVLPLADARLYEAKNSGRNRLVGAPGQSPI